MQILQSSPQSKDNTTLYCISAAVFFSLLLLFSLSSSRPPPRHSRPDPKLFSHPNHYLLQNPTPDRPDSDPPLPSPPSIAYFIAGSAGDLAPIFRVLLAVYHPANLYLLHLDRLAPQSERDQLALAAQSVPVFEAAQNVHVIGNPDFAYAKGSSPVSSVLRGASILLKLSSNWDWFINLSARDYPLVTQDDLLHIFSFLPKELNFVNHTSYIGWRESRRLKPIIVDPGLYLKDKTPMFYATEKREMPKAFRLFTGSPTAILSRKFIEFCISGPDNLPRTLLMYFANTQAALLNYFPTILCNSLHFIKTTVNHNLQYATFTNPSREDPRLLNSTNFHDMLSSGSAFATQFPPDDPTLDLIDQQLLGRVPGKVVPGGWCLGGSNDTCAEWGYAGILRPGPGSKRLEKRLVELFSNRSFRSQQCVVG